MARFSGAWKTAGAGTANTLPMASLYAIAAVRPVIREIGVFNTTANAFDVALRRATSLGGTHAGAASAELPEDDTVRVADAVLIDTDTGTAPTLTSGNLRVASLGAAIGSGVIWTFGGNGLVIPDGTANGVCIVGLASPQICTVYFVWDE
jgi:hypothetical protein